MKISTIALVVLGAGLAFALYRAKSPALATSQQSQYSDVVTLPYVQGVGGGIGSATGTIDLARTAQVDLEAFAMAAPQVTTSETLAAFLRASPRGTWESVITGWIRNGLPKEMVYGAEAKALGLI